MPLYMGIFLGLPWLRRHNLLINWEKGTIRIPSANCISHYLSEQILAKEPSKQIVSVEGLPLVIKVFKMSLASKERKSYHLTGVLTAR